MSIAHADLMEQAVGAARAGQRPTARRILETILEEQPADAQAWLWLSGVVDDPLEQVAALQRVIAIDPANARAHWGLQWLREHHPELWIAAGGESGHAPDAYDAAPPTDVEAAPVPVAPEAQDTAPMSLPSQDVLVGNAQELGATQRMEVPATEAVAPIDEEARCPFCGEPSDAGDRECGACRHALLVPEDRRRGARMARGALALLSLLTLAAVVASSLWLLGEVQRVGTAVPAVQAFVEARGQLPSAGALDQIVGGAGLALFGLALLSAIMCVGIALRWRAIYVLYMLLVVGAIAGGITLLLVDLRVLPGLLPLQLRLVDMIATIILVACMLITLVVLIGAWREFFPRWVRVRLIQREGSGAEHFRTGNRYRDRGWNWAAAQEFERAAAAEPDKLKYRRSLADMYSKLGNQARARHELRASVNLHPDTSPVGRAGRLVEEAQRERQ